MNTETLDYNSEFQRILSVFYKLYMILMMHLPTAPRPDLLHPAAAPAGERVAAQVRIAKRIA